jgi:hypothetical protein
MAKGRPTSAWQQARLDAEAARGLYGGNRWNGTQWVKPDGSPVQRAPKPPNPFGREGSLSKTLDKQLQRAVNQAVADHAPKNATLRANVDSSVFEDVTWHDNVLHVRFFRGGQIDYSFPDVSKDDFVDMVSSGSLGSWFNQNLQGAAFE